MRVVNPGPFGGGASIDDLFMVVIGGVGSLGGALLGPVVFELVRDWLREFLPWLVGRSGSFEIAAFGLLVMLMLQTASSGLMPLLAPFLPARPARDGRLRAPMRWHNAFSQTTAKFSSRWPGCRSGLADWVGVGPGRV